MGEIIMLRVAHGRQAVEIIDQPPDYDAIREAIGDTVWQLTLEGDIIALTAANESEQIICTWRNWAFVGDVILVTAKTADGDYRSLTAEEINKYMYEFGGQTK